MGMFDMFYSDVPYNPPRPKKYRDRNMTLTGTMPPMPKVPPPKPKPKKYGIFNVTKDHWLWDSRGDIFVFTDPEIANAQVEVLKVLGQMSGSSQLDSLVSDDELVVKAFVTVSGEQCDG